MSDFALPYSEAKSLGRHALFGLATALVLLGGFGYWAAVTPISGAVIASGSVVVDGGARRVQHQEGGIVRTILASNEDIVAAGDVLVTLDGTSIRANLAVIENQLAEALVKQARLIAESTGADEMVWPAVLDEMPDAAGIRTWFDAQDSLRRSRASTIASQTAQLREQIAQLEIQITGLIAQGDAIAREAEIVSGESDKLTSLLSQGLVESTRVADIGRETARLAGDAARTEAEIARARGTIAERELQITQIADAFRSEVLTELQTVSQAVAELMQQRIAATDRLARLDIRAPISGIIHESAIHTVGGVIGSGELLMQIVPTTGAMMVDVRVSPLDIDKIATGHPVTLKLASFDPRTAPELTASVTRISPDLSRDPVNGAQFYVVRVAVPDAELARLPETMTLVPGMPIEAFFTTGDRTVLSYLAKPVVDQMALVFRED